MQNLTERIDELFTQNRGKEAEILMEECLKEVLKEERFSEAVPILNELIGYCRETSQVEKSYEYADLAIMILDRLNLQGTIPYATTLLNIANAYRAGGRLEDSLNVYQHVLEIYQKKLNAEDMLFASLYNNISLLYQEMGRFELAKESLLQALVIVESKDGAAFEVAVTYANLATSALSLGQDEEAESYFTKAIKLFEENQIQDTHYYAALSAMATYYYKKGCFREAEKLFLRAKDGIEVQLGQNEYYYRMKENAKICRQMYERIEDKPMSPAEENTMESGLKGIDLCRRYYEAYGKHMLEKSFPEYLDKIAVGLVGEGSDCFGYDDEISRDHDWGPGFCMWVTEETYAQIGRKLQEAYEALPAEYMGHTFKNSVQGRKRRGVHTITQFYKRILGAENFPDSEWYCASAEEVQKKDTGSEQCLQKRQLISRIRWEQIEDSALAAAVNGEVFTDPEGIFTAVREVLKEGYPKRLQVLKIAESTALFCQKGQYNVKRMLLRGDKVTASLLLGDAVKAAMKLLYYVDGIYPPHDKWLLYGLKQKGDYPEILQLLERVVLENAALINSGTAEKVMDEIAEKLAMLLYQKHFISDIANYLDVHAGELLYKAGMADLQLTELAERIARLEFEAFDKVKNLGGRAECQDDWFTFSIMRISQYLTWNREMLLQYAYDFAREYERGHNLIEEKYGRMMESTAPAEYEAIKEHFPAISAQKKQIIEVIVEMQVKWMEEFAAEYPRLAESARSIHTYEDNPWNTSYETYLRGEISTYSDKMLELYGRYIVELSVLGENPARKIMEHSVLMYGYDSLADAEKALKEC